MLPPQERISVGDMRRHHLVAHCKTQRTENNRVSHNSAFTTSRSEVEDAREHNYPDANHYKASSSKHEVESEHVIKKIESAMTDADEYLVPSGKTGSVAEDQAEYHYPGLLVGGAPTARNSRNAPVQSEKDYLELDWSSSEEGVSKTGQTLIYEAKIHRV